MSKSKSGFYWLAMGRALCVLAYLGAFALMYWWGDAPYPAVKW